jgi:uncharacterized protein YndB with AHSA1/START domain
VSSTRLTRRLRAPRARVYRALLEAEAVGWSMSLGKLARLVEG